MSGFLTGIGLGFFSPGKIIVMLRDPEGDMPTAAAAAAAAATAEGMDEAVLPLDGSITGGESIEPDVVSGSGNDGRPVDDDDEVAIPPPDTTFFKTSIITDDSSLIYFDFIYI